MNNQKVFQKKLILKYVLLLFVVISSISFLKINIVKSSVDIFGGGGSRIDLNVDKSSEDIVVIAARGNGITHLARKAIKIYLEDNNETLNNEQKVYAEDYLRKHALIRKIKVGDKMSFSKDLIKNAIEKSNELKPNQIKNLTKYVARIISFFLSNNYENIIKEEISRLKGLNPFELENNIKEQNNFSAGELKDLENYNKNIEKYKSGKPWIASVCDGIEVYYKDIEEKLRWKTSNTVCNPPQCSLDGGQFNDSLVSDNNVDFSEYPAREACKFLGGRLPDREELNCISDNRYKFGNFLNDYYWSSNEYHHNDLAWVKNFSLGEPFYVYEGNKSLNLSIRCVRDTEL